ncbi:hypothetical protein EMCRGX_G032950 [Ephydatia muelleri]
MLKLQSSQHRVKNTYLYSERNTLISRLPRRPASFQVIFTMFNNLNLRAATVRFRWTTFLSSGQMKLAAFMSFFFYWRQLVWVLNPADVETVHMTTQHRKSRRLVETFGYLFGERLVGNGLFSIPDYKTWKPRRKLYDPAFNRGYLKSLVPKFCASADLFLDKLQCLADGKTQVPLKIHIHQATLDVISKVAFASDVAREWKDQFDGLPTSTEHDVDSLVGKAFKGIQTNIRDPFFKFLHPFEVRNYREVARTLRVIGRNCIQKRIKALNDGKDVPHDILSYIIKAATSDVTADIESLVDDFVTFYIAGQETTANTLAFAVVMVHQHPEVLERILLEVEEVLGGKVSVTAEDLDKLKFTEQVIDETLRIPGTISAVSKEAPIGGTTLSQYHIPAGTPMITPTAAMCRMPEYFEDPDSFNPSRFDPENKKPNPFIYFPFGVGHRSCIGRHFAMMEAKLILSRLVQTFQLTLPDGYKLEIVERTTRQPCDNIMCTLLPRKQHGS